MNIQQYTAIEGPAIPVPAKANKFNHTLPYVGVVLACVAAVNIIISLVQGTIWWYINIFQLVFLWIFCLYASYIPCEVKKAKDGSLVIKFQSTSFGCTQLLNPVVRTPEEHELDPKVCCNSKQIMSWCAQRDVETSIVLEGDVKGCCGNNRVSFVVPKTDQLSALGAATAV